jgi:N-acetylglutamate synthase
MSQVDVLSPDLLARAHANYHELYRTMARTTPDCTISERDGLVLVYSGNLLPHFNCAIVTRAPDSPHDLIERARSFYALVAPPGQRWALNASGDLIAEVRGEAARAGMLELSHSPGMLLAPLAGETPPVPGLRIEPVDDPATLRLYNDTMTAGFGGEWAQPGILEDRALLDVPGLTHYIGYLNDEPVATAMRFASHRIAGVFNVSTIPAARRRGIGAAITWQAALDGRAEGCIASYLQASDMGEPVYRHMGYRTVAQYQIWLTP